MNYQQMEMTAEFVDEIVLAESRACGKRSRCRTDPGGTSLMGRLERRSLQRKRRSSQYPQPSCTPQGADPGRLASPRPKHSGCTGLWGFSRKFSGDAEQQAHRRVRRWKRSRNEQQEAHSSPSLCPTAPWQSRPVTVPTALFAPKRTSFPG